MTRLAVVSLALLGCRDLQVPEEQDRTVQFLVRPLPAASGPVTLVDNLGEAAVTIRVSQAVLDAGDPRYLSTDTAPYTGQNAGWKWTEEQRILAAALDLRDVLTRISCGSDADLSYAGLCSGEIPIGPWLSSGDDAGSILVGRSGDFDYNTNGFVALTAFTREQHRIRTAGDRVLLLGLDSAGVEIAVWQFASRLGYRYFLPMPDWEIVPDRVGTSLLAPNINLLAGPAEGVAPGFLTRRLAGLELSLDPGYQNQLWQTRNGFEGSLQVRANQGQWGRIYENDVSWFTSNPDAVSGSSRPLLTPTNGAKVKFCPGYVEPGTGVTVAGEIYESWAKGHLENTVPSTYGVDISRDHLPLHHGDHAYWTDCDPAFLGGITPADRSLNLVNDVARLAMTDGTLGDRMIGLFGYREVFAGPVNATLDLDLRPHVFLYLFGDGYKGTTFDDAFAAWQAAGVENFGIYPYWLADTYELPLNSGPQAPVATAAYLAERQSQGVSSLWIETSGGWGRNGLFRWALLHVARDSADALTDPAGEVTALLEDVIGTFTLGARPHVRNYLSLLDTSDGRFLLSPDLLAEMYGSLALARAAIPDDTPEEARIDDFLIYVRHLELYWLWKEGSGSYDAFIEHAWCTDERRMTDYGHLWKPLSTEGVAYLATHTSQEPSQVAVCDAEPDVEGWIAGAPDPQLTGNQGWISEVEGDYALATLHPGNATASGGYEEYFHDLPRDVEMWKAWIDPAVGLEIVSACHGIADDGDTNPGLYHTTSRLMGEATLEISRPDNGAVACEVDLPPHREGWDVTFDSTGASAVDGAADGYCTATPRVLALDTGVPEVGVDASCDLGEFTTAGIYDFVIRNHRSGTDYNSFAGALGVSRWDTPFLPNDDRRPAMGNTYRYFYVPLGTTDVVLWNDGGACSVRATSTVTFDIVADGVPQYHVFPAGIHSGKIWALRMCKDTYLVNIPPVVAPAKELLMVPCDTEGDPAWAPRAANYATCPP